MRCSSFRHLPSLVAVGARHAMAGALALSALTVSHAAQAQTQTQAQQPAQQPAQQQPQTQAEPPAQPDNAVVARVDGVEIKASDLALAEEIFAGEVRTLNPQAKHDFLVNYVVDVLNTSKAAAAQHLAIDETALQQRMEFLRKKALMEKLLEKTAAAAMSDEALIHRSYDEAVKAASEPEVRLRAILFKFSDPKDEASVKAAEARAKEAIERIKKGEDFIAVNNAMTDSAEGKLNGGALGYMVKQQMGSEFAQVAFDLPVGAISDPIKTNVGWHVIKVEDRRTRTPPSLESVHDRFAQFVARKAKVDLLMKLRSEAKIERLDKTAEQQTEGEPGKK